MLHHALILPLLLGTAMPTTTPVYRDHARLLVYRDDQGREHPVRTPRDWARRRADILASFQLVAGPLPSRDHLPALDMQVQQTADCGSYTRQHITFVTEGTDRLPAYLLIPKSGGKRRLSAMLCLHQTIEIGKDEPVGLGGSENLHYAAELAERGYVALAPDYSPFGEYKTDPFQMGYVSGTMKGIVNHMRAVDLLQSLPDVDPDRIGVIGHSLGGHNSLFVAAFDPRLKVVVTSCGFTSFPKYYEGDLTGWTSDRYMPRIDTVYGKDPARVPFDFPEILAAIAPRSIFVNAPLRDGNFDWSGVDDCVNAARGVFRLLGNPDGLQLMHPDAEHSFPPEVREKAYEFAGRQLRRG